MRFHFRPLLLLPAVAIFIAAAILWGGVVLSKQVRVERVAGDGTALATFSSGLQEEIHSLENRYRDHLETLCRGDLDDSFTLRDSINAIVGVRQISTLDTNGQVEQHLLASEVEEDEAVIPLPVFDQNRLPVGRRHPFVIEDPASFNGTKDGTWGWLGSGSERFYFSKVSDHLPVRAIFRTK